jgi:hypothetical protein
MPNAARRATATALPEATAQPDAEILALAAEFEVLLPASSISGVLHQESNRPIGDERRQSQEPAEQAFRPGFSARRAPIPIPSPRRSPASRLNPARGLSQLHVAVHLCTAVETNAPMSDSALRRALYLAPRHSLPCVVSDPTG